MGLEKVKAAPSSRMGMVFTLGSVGHLAVLEFGSMGHTIYQEKYMNQWPLKTRGVFYSTHIDEKDIALGISDRIGKAIKEIQKNSKIHAIALIPSSIGQITGVDLESILYELEDEGIIKCPVFTLNKGGFQYSVSDGIEEALYQLVVNLIDEESTYEIEKDTYNIIGACWDNEGLLPHLEKVKKIMNEKGFHQTNTLLTIDTTVEQVTRIRQAAVNVVIRPEGMKIAKWLKKQYDMPYIEFFMAL